MTLEDENKDVDLENENNGASVDQNDTGADDQNTGADADDAGAEDDKNEDYRTKLNIQNRFLEKEGYEFKDGKWQKKPAPTQKKSDDQAPSNDTTLSQKDMFALLKADVHEDDIQEVTDYAKLKGISVSDALKAPVIKTLLRENNEERSTARATNVQGGARGSSKVSTEKLLADAKKGIMPDNDADMERLIAAQMEQKRSRK